MCVFVNYVSSICVFEYLQERKAGGQGYFATDIKLAVCKYCIIALGTTDVKLKAKYVTQEARNVGLKIGRTRM